MDAYTLLSPHPPPILSTTTARSHPKPKPQTLTFPIDTKHPSSIARHLHHLATTNRLSSALSLLDHLSDRSIPVTPTAFSALISASLRARSLTSALAIKAHLASNSLHSNAFLLTKLVLLFSSLGAPHLARDLLDQIPHLTSVFPWNALLRGIVIRGARGGREAVEVFDEMRRLGVEANEYSYLCLVKSIAGSPSATLAAKAHANLVKSGFINHSVLLMTSLVDMYFKCRKPRWALKVFEEIPKGCVDVVGWGAVIAGFSHNGLRREALEYFRWMGEDGFEPNSVVLTTVLPVIGELGERDLGREIHGFVMKRFRDYARRDFMLSGLVDMYCKCGDIVSARRVFSGSSKRNTVLWTALISGYSSSRRFDQALRSIIWMQQEGVKPDVVSIATVLPVCTKLKALRPGKEIHAYALKRWFLPNISISTSLMTMYSSCGNLVYARKIFDGMERKNVVAWTAMTSSYLKNGSSHDALGMFRSMQLSKQRPDSVAMATALSACSELKALKLGKETHGQVLKKKLEWQPFVSAEIITMYGKCNKIGMGKQVFDHVSSKGLLTWTSIINAHGFNGLYSEAINLFGQMQSEGFVPNHFTFDVVLSICKRGGLVDEALKAYDSMVLKYNLKPSEEQHNCMVDLMQISGQTQQARRFAKLRESALA